MAKILLLEDDDLFSNSVERVLQGHSVLRARSVDRAIESLTSGEIDCALIDLNLTDSNDRSGVQLLAYMSLNCPYIPKAVITGSDLREEGAIHRNLMQKYGVAEIIIKGDAERHGVGTRDLIEVVGSLIESGIGRERARCSESLSSYASSHIAALNRRIELLETSRKGLGIRFRGKSVSPRRALLTSAVDKIRDALEDSLNAIATADPGSLSDIRSVFEAGVREAERDL
jgi:CheY-like chemotaxis protein